MKTTFLLTLALMTFNIVNAQWTSQISGTTEMLRSIYFSGTKIGYAVGDKGTILKTNDGGTVWSPQISGTTKMLNSVWFTNETIGYISSSQGVILKTNNSGINWSLQSSGTTQLLISIYFTNENTGFIVGTSGTIIKTTNGGTNWSSMVSGTDYNLISVQFIDESTGYILGSKISEHSFTPVAFIILKTTDGGNNWITASSGTSDYFNSMYFTNINTGYIVGDHSILKTTDGGINWIKQNSPEGIIFTSIFFTDINTGYVVSAPSNCIVSTKNAGVTWNCESAPPDLNNALNYVFFTDFNNGYAVGNYGTIIKRTNIGDQGIEENSNGKILVVFPNPVINEINIQVPQNAIESTLIISDIRGQELLKRPINNIKTRLDLSDLKSGVYFIKLINDKTLEVYKIIKE